MAPDEPKAKKAVALLYDSFNQRRPDEEGLVFYGEAIKNGTLSLVPIWAGTRRPWGKWWPAAPT